MYVQPPPPPQLYTLTLLLTLGANIRQEGTGGKRDRCTPPPPLGANLRQEGTFVHTTLLLTLGVNLRQEGTVVHPNPPPHPGGQPKTRGNSCTP